MDKKKILFIGISVLVCLLVYIPTPKGIDPEEYSPAQPVNLDDLQISKDKLRNAVYINTPAEGAQDVQIDKRGFIYSGLHDGSIVKINPSNSEIKVVARSQGPIFGLDLNKRGDKIAIADQNSGIKILDLKSGQFSHVVSQYNGVKFASPNAVVFGQNDQELFFTVSSEKIPMSDFHEMLLYSEGSGKIFSYNLKQKNLEVLADNLYFVNGLEFSSKDNCLYFIQTSRSRLSKLELSSQKRGNTTIITDNILGYPDNVKLTESGDLWIAIPALRDSFSNIIDHNSIIRRVILNLRMPLGMFMTLANMKYAGGIRVNPKTKQVVQYFFGNSDYINCISGINEKDGKLYLSSLSQNKIAVVDLNENMGNTAEKVEKIVEKIEQIQANPAEDKIVKKEQRTQVKVQKAAASVQEIVPEAIQKQVKKVQNNKQQVSEVKQKIEKVEEKVIGKEDTTLNAQDNENTNPEQIQIIQNAQFFNDLENKDETLINKLENIEQKVQVKQQIKPSGKPTIKPTSKTTKPQIPTNSKASQSTTQKTTQSSTTSQKAKQTQSSQQSRSSQQKGSTGRSPQYNNNRGYQNGGYGKSQYKKQANSGNQQL